MPEQSEEDLVAFYRQSRQWEPARHQATLAQGSHNPFKVLTFNLLAQGHIKRCLFPYCAKETLKWPYRRVRLIAELKAYQADICCFQVS
jgi:mRNA deadenylase 3'-5' endonuclease subunit Ccr4